MLMGSNEAKTSDLYFAAYLRVAGVSLAGTSRDGARTFFLFGDVHPGVLNELHRQYYTGEARVPALFYSQVIRDMKSMLRV